MRSSILAMVVLGAALGLLAEEARAGPPSKLIPVPAEILPTEVVNDNCFFPVAVPERENPLPKPVPEEKGKPFAWFDKNSAGLAIVQAMLELSMGTLAGLFKRRGIPI